MHGDEFVAVAAACSAPTRASSKRCAVAGSTTRPSCTSSRGRAARSSPVRLAQSAHDRLGAARRQRRQPLLAPAVRPGRRGRSQRDDRAPHRRPRPRDTPAERGRRRLPRRRRSALPGRPAAHLDHATGRAELRSSTAITSRWQKWRSARRVPPPRGPHASRHRLRRTPGSGARSATAPRSRSWSSPTATRTRLRTSRTCSTSASTGWGAHELVGAGLRLPRRDPYLDGVTNTWSGEPLTIPNAICIHEEDDSILWKHTDEHSGRVDRARSRRLVDLVHRDRRQLRVRLLLVLLPGRLVGARGEADGNRPHRRLGVGRALAVFAADRGRRRHEQPPALLLRPARPRRRWHGERRLRQPEALCEPWGPANPDGTAFRPERLTLRAGVAGRGAHISPQTARRFRVENRARAQPHRRSGRLRAHPGRERLPHTPARLVRTPARAASSTTTSGSPPTAATSATRPASIRTSIPAATGCRAGPPPTATCSSEDVVLWYVFGSHHFPRLEDWPVMPVVSCGFHLRPVGFFDLQPRARRTSAAPGWVSRHVEDSGACRTGRA